MRVSLIVYDLFGVICSRGFESSVGGLKAVFNLDPILIKPAYRYWEKLFDLGKINERQFWQNVNRDLNTNVPPKSLSNIVLSGYHANKATIQMVERYKNLVEQIVYSNYRRSWFNKLDRRLEISKHFKHVYISSDTGLLKPNKKIFTYIGLKHHTPLKQMLLVDDESANVNHAIRIGVNGIKFKDVYSSEPQLRKIMGSPKELNYQEFYSGLVLLTRDGALILQQRESNVEIANPGMLSVFGGRSKVNEKPFDCAIRELYEETGVRRNVEDLIYLGELSCPSEQNKWMLCSFFAIKDIKIEEIKLKEGSDFPILWARDAIKRPDITPVTKSILSQLIGRDRNDEFRI